MKKSILLTCGMVCLLMTGYSQNYNLIWGGPGDPNSEFDGGLNDWTAMAGTSSVYNVPPDCASNRTPTSTEADPDAVWVWDANGTAASGAFWGTRGPIASTSVANGTAVFNSSFLDNGGSDSNCGGGSAPSPHTGSLVSPSFSCEGHSSVFVRFHQYFRNFVATTSVDVSIDGGTTWTRDTINGQLSFNDETSTGDVQLIDISSIAANQPNVMIRFTFSGEYYFWIIDDVYVIEQADQDLALGDFFMPFNYATPASQITTDTSVFLVDVINKGKSTINDYRVKVRLFNQETNEVVYQDSVEGPASIASGDTLTVDLPGTYIPGDVPAGTVYTMEYKVDVLDVIGLNPGGNLEVRGTLDDANPADNIKTQDYVVSSFTYSKDSNPVYATKPALDGNYSIGNVYRTATFWPDNTKFKATEATVCVARSGQQSLQGFSVALYLLEVADSIAKDFTKMITLPDIGQDNPQLKIIATANLAFSDEENFDLIPVNLLDFETFDQGVDINPGKAYILLIRYKDAANELLQAFNDDIKYFYTSTIVYLESTGIWYISGFGPEPAAVLRLRIDLTTTVDEIALPDYSVKVYPNPASNVINLDMALDTANDGIVVIADLSGRVIEMRSFQQTQNHQFTFDSSKFANGVYLVRLATRNGSKTTKVVIQH